MEVELRIAKITGKRGKKVGKKCLCVVFWLTSTSRFYGGKNAFGGILQHEQQAIACERATACCQTHSDYGPPKMPLKLAV